MTLFQATTIALTTSIKLMTITVKKNNRGDDINQNDDIWQLTHCRQQSNYDNHCENVNPSYDNHSNDNNLTWHYSKQRQSHWWQQSIVTKQSQWRHRSKLRQPTHLRQQSIDDNHSDAYQSKLRQSQRLYLSNWWQSQLRITTKVTTIKATVTMTTACPVSVTTRMT